MKNNVQATISNLLLAFENGSINQAICRTVIKRQKGDKPSNSWSMLNRVIMYLNQTEDARTFLQWKTIERKVNRASKAFYILAPCTRKIKKTETDLHGNETQVTVPIIIGFKELPVFRLEDTGGKEITPVTYTPPVLPPLIDVAHKMGLKVEYTPSNGFEYGYYSPAENLIVLRTYDFCTLAHELSHAAHNQIRPLKSGQDADQEILAQFCSEVLCQLYGETKFTGYTYRYIQSYAKENTPDKIIARIANMLNEVEQVLDLILFHVSQTQTA